MVKTGTNPLLIFISLLLALIIFSVKPTAVNDDLFRFYVTYEEFKNLTIKEFLDFALKLPDFVVPILIFIFAKLHIPVNFLLSIVTFFSVYLIGDTSRKIILRKLTNLELLLIISAINVVGLLSGVRSFLSVAIIFSALYQWYYNKKIITSVALVLFAIFCHFSALIFIPLFFITKNLSKKNIPILFLVAAIFGVLFQLLHLYKIPQFSFLPNSYTAKLSHYLYKQELWNFTSGKVYFVVLVLLSWFPVLLYYLIYLYKNSNFNHYIVGLLFVLVALSLVYLPNYVLFSRFSYLTKVVWTVCLVYIPFKNKKLNLVVYAHLFFLFLIQLLLYFESFFNIIK